MKNKKIIKRIAIILSMIILLIDICIFIKMKYTFIDIGSSHHQYENVSLIIVGFIRYASLIYGILLIPIIWLEYFLMTLVMKIYNKFDGLKRFFISLILLIAIIAILVLFIRMILLIIVTLT